MDAHAASAASEEAPGDGAQALHPLRHCMLSRAHRARARPPCRPCADTMPIGMHLTEDVSQAGHERRASDDEELASLRIKSLTIPRYYTRKESAFDRCAGARARLCVCACVHVVAAAGTMPPHGCSAWLTAAWHAGTPCLRFAWR